MDKQLIIDKFRNVTDRDSLLKLLNEIKADLLGSDAYPFTMRKMMLLCNPNLKRNRYRHFTIPKKSGGKRNIYSPNGNLKWLQLCLNEIFKAVYTPSNFATGFVQGKNVVDNAEIHTNQNYVFNIDLADFFPSIHQARVWKRIQLPPFNANKEVANVIAGICAIKDPKEETEKAPTESYSLPQGAPTSPILTNAICDTLDRRLAGLAKRFGLYYSRYADDITFSSTHNVYQEGSPFRCELMRIIAGQGFSINPKKTRLQHCSRRQEVTGLTVSKKVNVTRKFIKNLRAIIHIWERHGYYAAISSFLPRYLAEKGHMTNKALNLANIIHGKLCYLKMVKGENDPVFQKLYAQYKSLTIPQHATSQDRSIEYLNTLSLSQFEKIHNVTLHFKKSSNSHKPYGYFDKDGQRIFFAVSSRILIEKIPANAQISLCKEINSESFDSDAELFYIIHHPLKNKNLQNTTKPTPGKPLEIPIEPMPEDSDILTKLIQANFDLSILP